MFIVERIEGITWCMDYKAVVISEDELHAERYARLNIDDFRKAKLKVTEVNLDE